MFTKTLENASVHNGTVRLRTLDNNGRYEDDRRNYDEERLASSFKYSLFIKVLPAKEMRSARYAWAILQHA